ncbi:MAG TPA: hypothetical protein VFR48_02910 [Solirubrobacteraceae bacterium]|nr:hypothetical protein [Solirubrobacteraceae bacterium]
MSALSVVCFAGAPCAPAVGVIASPATIDGPSSAIGEFGGAAVSSDGSGGVVYTKQVGGVQHVFAAQYSAGRWQPPVRVDWGLRYYAASYPRIAAADGGWLVVVWVAQIATVKGRPQDALYSSTLLPGASSFGEPFIVDPDVGEGQGVSPSVALAASGQGLVAYRAITDNFSTSDVSTTIRPLRPGDVLEDIRVARYDGQLWSSPQRVNRDPLLSMRPPSESTSPQAGVGRGDEAVIAWQEPDPSGVARIWSRRVFPSTLGLAMQASPSTYQGQPVTGDANALALSVSEFGEAKVVSRVQGAAGTALSGSRLFVDTLPVSTSPKGAQFSGPVLADGGRASPSAGGVGTPSVSVDDEGAFRIAFTAGSSADVLVGDEQHQLVPEVALGAAATAGVVGAVTALDPAGGGVTAWPATGVGGLSGVALREDFPNGAAQSALISGAIDGPVFGLALAGSESGESLVAFREGDPGNFEIVAAPVSVPPPQFFLELPTGWVRPAQARISWSSAEDATGGVSYALVLDGRVVRRGIRSLSVLADRRLLGSGARHVQILADDASGQQTLSGEGVLKVDGRAPVARVRHGRGRSVLVTVRDAQSGAVARDTHIAFGDGANAGGRLTVRHSYQRAGRYVIVVRMGDRVGNRGTARLRVMVG